MSLADDFRGAMDVLQSIQRERDQIDAAIRRATDDMITMLLATDLRGANCYRLAALKRRLATFNIHTKTWRPGA